MSDTGAEFGAPPGAVDPQEEDMHEHEHEHEHDVKDRQQQQQQHQEEEVEKDGQLRGSQAGLGQNEGGEQQSGQQQTEGQATDRDGDSADETQSVAATQGEQGAEASAVDHGDTNKSEEQASQQPVEQQSQDQPEHDAQEDAETESAAAQESQQPNPGQGEDGAEQGKASQEDADDEGDKDEEEGSQNNDDEAKEQDSQRDGSNTADTNDASTAAAVDTAQLSADDSKEHAEAKENTHDDDQTSEQGGKDTTGAHGPSDGDEARETKGEENEEVHGVSNATHMDDASELGPEKADLPEPPATASTSASADESAGAAAADSGTHEGGKPSETAKQPDETKEGQEPTEQGKPESGLTKLKEAGETQEDASGSGVQEGHSGTHASAGTDSTSQEQEQQADAAYTQAAAGDGTIAYAERQQIVKVKLEDGNERIYNLTVMTSQARKPFLGGYRHKKTGVEYHNASSQTPRKFRMPKTERFTRTTQTAIQRTHPKFATQTSVHTATQMTKEGVFVTSQEDKVITPTVYETAADRHARLVAAVIVIQKFYRRWKAKRVVGNLRYAKQRYQQWLEEKERKRLEFEELMRQRELDRRLNPRTAEDFDMLYASLQKWHAEELERIRLLPESEQHQARMDLLREETKYLNYIEQLKHMAAKDNKEARVQKFLQDASSGRSWINKEYGKKVQVETPESKLAQELRDIYNLISIPDLDVDERLDALLQLKTVVEKHDSRLTREILELVQREADLLGRRTRIKNLEGLRKRLLNLFLQFVETPEYNPEAKHLMEVHQEKDFFKHNLVRCAGTQSFHTTSKFEVSPQKTTGLGKSRAVLAAENRALYREDNTVYRRMLDDCRKKEKAFGDNSQCMLLMSVRDLRYLVETIWGGKSALSDEASAGGLELCRWDKSKELTPWNSILLTREEAEEHLSLPSVHDSYGPLFVAKVNQRHIRAKQHFSSLQSHLARAHRQVGKAPPKPRQLPSVAAHHHNRQQQQQQQQQQLSATTTSSSAA